MKSLQLDCGWENIFVSTICTTAQNSTCSTFCRAIENAVSISINYILPADPYRVVRKDESIHKEAKSEKKEKKKKESTKINKTSLK